MFNFLHRVIRAARRAADDRVVDRLYAVAVELEAEDRAGGMKLLRERHQRIEDMIYWRQYRTGRKPHWRHLQMLEASAQEIRESPSKPCYVPARFVTWRVPGMSPERADRIMRSRPDMFEESKMYPGNYKLIKKEGG